MRSHLPRTLFLAIVSIVGILGFASSVQAQMPAGGDGRALDARNNAQRAANAQRPDLMQEVRMRNAIVTGNAPNGRSLRVGVGYTSPNDFRGVLASDSTYRFRRDSLSSAAGVRGADSLQYQYALTTGNAYSSQGFSRFEGGGGAPAPVAFPAPRRDDDTDAPKLSAQVQDQLRSTLLTATISPATNSGLGMLRSSASYQSNQLLSPVIIGSKPNADRNYVAVAASPLVGVRDALIGSSRYESVRRSQYAAASAATASAAPTNSAAAQSAATPAFKTAYEDLRARAADLFPPPTDSEPKPAAGTTPGASGTPGDAANPPDDAPKGSPIDNAVTSIRDRLMGTEKPKATKAGQSGATKPDDEATKKDDDSLIAVDPRDLELLKKLSSRTNTFSSGNVLPRDYFAENMRDGEKLMGEGSYFDAEERFSRALTYKAGEPAAMVARLHAQLGAGLFVSAALNARTLLNAHPELIPTRWTGPTVPTPERAKEIMKILKGGLEDPPLRYAPPPETAALLLAYMGWQSDNLAEVARGLDALQTLNPKEPLSGVLRAIWLAPGAGPAPSPSDGEKGGK